MLSRFLSSALGFVLLQRVLLQVLMDLLVTVRSGTMVLEPNGIDIHCSMLALEHT